MSKELPSTVTSEEENVERGNYVATLKTSGNSVVFFSEMNRMKTT